MSRHPVDPDAPIAIVGVGALFPDAVDKAGFWRNILGGRDSMTEVPPTKFVPVIVTDWPPVPGPLWRSMPVIVGASTYV